METVLSYALAIGALIFILNIMINGNNTDNSGKYDISKWSKWEQDGKGPNWWKVFCFSKKEVEKA